MVCGIIPPVLLDIAVFQKIRTLSGKNSNDIFHIFSGAPNQIFPDNSTQQKPQFFLLPQMSVGNSHPSGHPVQKFRFCSHRVKLPGGICNFFIQILINGLKQSQKSSQKIFPALRLINHGKVRQKTAVSGINFHMPDLRKKPCLAE